MRENCQSGSEGGARFNPLLLPNLFFFLGGTARGEREVDNTGLALLGGA
jgi:hypothetical protein